MRFKGAKTPPKFSLILKNGSNGLHSINAGYTLSMLDNIDFERKVLKCFDLQVPYYIKYGLKGLIKSQNPPGLIETLILIVSQMYQHFHLDKL